MNKREIGKIYEQLAKEYLIQQGYDIVEQNYYCQKGEIDIVARDGAYLVFVEVKYRKNHKIGSALEAIDWNKKKRICNTALVYMMERKISIERPIRFDVVAIDKEEIVLIKNAFDYFQ